MLSKKIEDALNKQLNLEMFSSYLYLSMAAYFESTSLPGMAGWMRAQAEEEFGHAMKFFGFINERGGRVVLDAIERPKTEWNSPLDVFQDAYEHEQHITKTINELVELAAAERDHATSIFLQWFVTEQVEEEATVQQIIAKLKLVSEAGPAILMLDRELGQRGS